MPEVLHCTGICTAVRWLMQRAAWADAAHCVICPNPPSLSPQAISPVQGLSSPIPQNVPLALHQPDSDTLMPHSETSGRTARRPIEHNAHPTTVHSGTYVYHFLIIAKRNPQKHREQLVFPANCLTLQERRGKTSPRVHEKQPDRTPQPA